jgi:hypothetical protein
VDQVHGSALHSGQCATCCEAHTNFADESACLTADYVPNEVVIIHRLQMVLKMLSSLHFDILHTCFVKKTHVQQSFLHLQHTNTNFHWMTSAIVLPFLHQTLILQSLGLDVSVIF